MNLQSTRRALFTIIFGCAFHLFQAQFPVLDWQFSLGADYSDYGSDIAFDSEQNLYITGSFLATVDFDPGPGVFSMNSLQGHVFLACYSEGGDLIWAKQFGDNIEGGSYSVEVDNQDNIYILGTFSTTEDFDPGTQMVNITPQGEEDVFLSKFDQDGNLIWIKTFGTEGAICGAEELESDSNDNLYVQISYEGTLDFDPGPDEFITTATNTDIAIVKFDSDGNFLFVKNFIGTDYEYYARMTIDAQDNLFAMGNFKNQLVIDSGETLTGELDIYNGYVVKINSIGEVLFAKIISGIDDVLTTQIVSDHEGSILLAGTFKQEVDFDLGQSVYLLDATDNSSTIDFGDQFILKLTNGGDFLWAKQYVTKGNNAIWGIITDVTNRVWVTGYYVESIDFDPGQSSEILLTDLGTGVPHAFFLNLEMSGDFAAVTSMIGNGASLGYGIDYSSSESLAFIGTHASSNELIVNDEVLSFQTEESNDIFVLKFQGSSAGISPHNTIQNLRYSPNPVSAILHVAGSSDQKSDVHCRVLNTCGQLLLSVDPKSMNFDLDMSSYSPGLYYIEISTSDKIEVVKIEKQ